MTDVRTFRDLGVWQKSLDVAVRVYKLTAAFPADERFGLVSQMRRAAVSIPSNIAEGHSRNSTGEYLQSLGVARGSLAELQTQADLARRLEILLSDQHRELESELREIGRMLNGLRTALRAKPGP
jgi:four helix bundle protein